MAQAPQHYVFYFAAPPEKVWDAFVSPESNRTIFMGAELKADLRPGGRMDWMGSDPKGNHIIFVGGEVLKTEPPKLLQYGFNMGGNAWTSRVTLELTPESEATRVSVTHDNWADDDPGYADTADGWPRILSRMKTLVETGKTFKPH